MKTRNLIGTASAVMISAVAVTTAPGAIASAAEVAPGAPMRMQTDAYEDEPIDIPLEIQATGGCSQGVPGTVTLPDGTTKNVLVSAGHCLYGIEGDGTETYPEVYAPLYDEHGLIAQREHGEKVYPAEDSLNAEQLAVQYNGADWATAEIPEGVEATRVADSVDQYGRRHGEPVELTGVRDYRDLGPWEVSFDNFGQPICKDGQTSGRTCGVQVLRTSNGLWHTALSLPGDSGGVNFDPNNGEALGVTSMGFYGFGGRAQPIDVAIEEVYGIPDGEVNEHFTLPESTQLHTPMYTLEEESQRKAQWAEENLPEEMTVPEEPLTLEDAQIVAEVNFEAGVGEARLQTQDAVNTLSQDPTQVGTVVESAIEGTQRIGGLVEQTAEVYEAALQNSLTES
ncbi:hypothetical protein [Corynebacterium lowii]|uniref:Trypsin n=1 Tax=Corynebacterium lowii TaxID=1544413 RepID=A0A0Q0U3T1_9CORY|nr:hypothetical protein [Corynebacterium lowii]KQB86604.1 hypothetical protein Clow_00812 [Corynebacterium lowii]MDP9851288.1 hypothetical protein [Corynebacterium lowii]